MTKIHENTDASRLGETDLPQLGLRGILAVAGTTIGMAAGFGVMILSSIFLDPLTKELGWNRGTVSLGYVCAAIGMATGGLLWGRVFDKIDIRWMLAMGGTFQVLPLAMLAHVSYPWQFFAAHLILGFLGFGALYAPFVAVASDWAISRRGLVMGIVTAGGAIGQGALPYWAQTLITAYGWRTAYWALALAMLITQLTIFSTVRFRIQRRSSQIEGEGVRVLFSTRLAALGFAAFCCCACMGMPLVHLAGYISMICGSANLGATSLLVAMLSGTVGRVVFGLLADRIGNFSAYRAAALSQALCVVFFPFLSSFNSLIVLSLAFGFSFSGNMTCMLLCIREEAPPERIGSAVGCILFIAWLGMGMGGYLGGGLFDFTGSYKLAFCISAVFGLAAFVLLSTLDRGHGISISTWPHAKRSS
ncbi:MFS transporter [Aestuariivirga sp.]|uniref:MFS transporter n=1 Tax=Aestuariivirga sp. TaxID=2650926 RepID=UPI0039E6E4DB